MHNSGIFREEKVTSCEVVIPNQNPQSNCRQVPARRAGPRLFRARLSRLDGLVDERRVPQAGGGGGRGAEAGRHHGLEGVRAVHGQPGKEFSSFLRFRRIMRLLTKIREVTERVQGNQMHCDIV